MNDVEGVEQINKVLSILEKNSESMVTVVETFKSIGEQTEALFKLYKRLDERITTLEKKRVGELVA